MPSSPASPEVKLLPVNRSAEKVKVSYNGNAKPLLLPLIGPRPPYYCNPRYTQYYPVM